MTTSELKRVAFFVDGFNLYHSVCSAEKSLSGTSLKWLDLNALFHDQLLSVEGRVQLSAVHYFTAYAEHLHLANPGKVKRHRAYVRALTATGVRVELSHFKRKDAWDTRTGQQFLTHEEKETDVAIACAVLEGAATDAFDTAVLVTGDTDLRPLVHTFNRLHADRQLFFAFPYDRKNRELARIAPGSFTLSAESYAKHQLPERIRLPSGKHVYRPDMWASKGSEEGR